MIYLNDVRKGGGTRFSKLGITVEPKVGRVVVWPNTLEDAPDRMDPMTVHEALRVESGEKYGKDIHIGMYMKILELMK